MAVAKEAELQLSFPLDLGVDNRSVTTSVQPVGPTPALVASANTRLGQVPGAPIKSPKYTLLTSTSNAYIAGFAASGGSTAVFAKTGTKRITSTGIQDPLGSAFSSSTKQNSYYPYAVSKAGVVPGGGTYSSPATCVDSNGITWFASVRADNWIGSAVFVTAINASGELVLAPTQVALITGLPSTQPWCALTSHGTAYVTIWWLDTGVIKAQQATIDQSTLSLTLVATPTSVYTPVSTPTGSIAVHSDNSGTYAWLVCRNSAAATSVQLLQVNVNTWGVGSVSEALGSNANYVGIRHLRRGSTDYVAFGVGRSAGSAYYYLYNGVTLARTWTKAGAAVNGNIACSFFYDLTNFYVVFAATHPFGSVSGLQGSGTIVSFHNSGTGATIGTAITLPWKGLVSNGAWDRTDDGAIRPVFALQNVYSLYSSSDPASIDFVSDPAVEIYRCVDANSASMVGRFGVDTAAIYPAVSTGSPVVNSNNLECTSSTITLTYLEDPTLLRDQRGVGYQSRYVTLSTSPKQPRIQTDGKGLAIIGAGPAYWDGQEVAEWCPTQRPKVYVEQNTGATVTGAGTYLVSAVVSWKDSATGEVHRSFPAESYSITLGAADKPTVHVTLPTTLKNGTTQEGFQVVVYVSQNGGTVLYAQSYTVSSTSSYFYSFTDISAPQLGVLNPAIYSDGSATSPLGAQCPPSFADVAIVAGRAWGVEGENPHRAWFTKPKEDGIVYEWSSELTVEVPASAGKILAIVESGGLPTLLCSRGTFVVTGSGPDVTNKGAFNDPEQTSEISCTDAASVIKTPAGTMFISGDHFAIVSGGGARLLDQFDASVLGTVSPVLLRDYQEVVWFSSSGTHAVYNYSMDRFTTWTTTTAPSTYASAYDETTNLIYVVGSAGDIGEIDPDLASTTAQMIFTTGAIRFGGPEDDNVIRDIIVHSEYLGAHGVTAYLWCDYGKTSITRTYSSADITSIVENSRYTLSVAAPTTPCRAFELSLVETGSTGDAFRPISVTITYGKNPGTLKSAILRLGRK